MSKKEMSRNVCIALDAMGGDFGAKRNVEAALLALKANIKINIELFGDEAEIRKHIPEGFNSPRLTITHTTEVIKNTDAAASAIKSKKDSSIVRGLRAVREGRCDAFVSCGSTGAVLSGGQLLLGREKGVLRAPLAFVVPTLKGPAMIIDCGASVDSKAAYLLQFAKMGSIYMEKILNVAHPRVSLVSIGEEEEKGNALVKDANSLLKKDNTINYIGPMESRAIPMGEADVFVCDAFVGNTILKMYEGVSKALMSEIKAAFMKNAKTKLAALFMKKSLKELMKRFSVDSYGGAPLLGLKGLVVKTHGNSSAQSIKNTLLDCERFIELDITGKIKKEFGK